MRFTTVSRMVLSLLVLGSLSGATTPTRAEEGLSAPADRGVPQLPRPRYGRISGYKFQDLNQNGADDSEPRLAGWVIRLTSLGPIAVDRTTETDENGEFSFRRLPLQRYRVCEIIPDVTPPWTATRPPCVTLRLTRSERVGIAIFGNDRRGSITGYKFNDLNGNGSDDAEPRLAGWTIRLTSLGPVAITQTATTDSSGNFNFDSLPIQAYLVCEVIPEVTPPWLPTLPACVTVTLTADVTFGSAVFGNRQQEEDGLGCTRTQGYWGNAPAGIARLRELVTTLLLGTVGYGEDQLLAILDTADGGNAVIKLAHQLIAAKLNILNGASNTPISSTITQADAALGSLLIPPVGSAYVAPSSVQGQVMVALATTLDTYNNGEMGVPHCE